MNSILEKLACLTTAISSITSFDGLSFEEIWAIMWVFLDEANNAAQIPNVPREIMTWSHVDSNAKSMPVIKES